MAFMVTHLGVALVTYNALVRLVPVESEVHDREPQHAARW
jgi:hypothetical protein